MAKRKLSNKEIRDIYFMKGQRQAISCFQTLLFMELYSLVPSIIEDEELALEVINAIEGGAEYAGEYMLDYLKNCKKPVHII